MAVGGFIATARLLPHTMEADLRAPGYRAQIAGRTAEPFTWIVLAVVVLRLPGVTWGLPASDGWDNDGVAPRDFLPGLIETFTPGHYFTYPPLHLALLAVATFPVTLIALLRAPSLAPAAIVQEFIHVPYMTAYSCVARAIAIVMSVGIIRAVASIAEETGGKRAGLWAAAVCSVNVVFVYYGATSNLDVPYLFWGVLALLELGRAIARDEPIRLRKVAAFAAFAVATKDQAYAFVACIPVVVVLASFLSARERDRRRLWLRSALGAGALAVGLLLLIDGAFFNPSGFVSRLRFLMGPASQPHASYSADAKGRLLALFDTVALFHTYYPVVFAVPTLAGLWSAVRVRGARTRLAALVPLAGIIAFSLAFNCVARRTEHRFLLPQMILWSVFAGRGFDAIWSGSRQQALGRVAACALTTLSFSLGFFRCVGVVANLVMDPRYEVEAWLDRHVAPGDAVEVHGNTVYALRLPRCAHVVRVGTDPPEKRNPLFAAVEQRDALMNIGARQPKWVVVNMAYAGHFTGVAASGAGRSGRIQSPIDTETNSDADRSTFFRALFKGTLGYQVVHRGAWTSRLWPRFFIHSSVSPEIFVFERTP